MPSLGGMLRRRKGREPAAQEPEETPVAGAEAATEPEPEATARPLFADE